MDGVYLGVPLTATPRPAERALYSNGTIWPRERAPAGRT